MTRTECTLREDWYTFVIISRLILLRRRNEKVVERIKTHTFSSITIFNKNLAIYEIMRKKICRAGQAADGNIIRRMRISCRISEATNTYSECVIHIAFPLQHWLHERASILRYMYITCLVFSDICIKRTDFLCSRTKNFFGIKRRGTNTNH